MPATSSGCMSPIARKRSARSSRGRTASSASTLPVSRSHGSRAGAGRDGSRVRGAYRGERTNCPRSRRNGSAMPTRVAINGFGRVGRAVLRAAHEQHADLEIVAVNDLMDRHTMAHLLRYDSVYGRFDGTVEEGEGE